MKKKLLQLLLVLFLFSLPFIAAFIIDEIRIDRRPVYYEYNGIVITQIQVDVAEINFYYGKYTKKNLPDSYITAKYSGISGSLDSYLWFRDNGQILIVPGGCVHFSQEGVSNDKFYVKNSWDIDSKEDFPTQNNYGTAIRVSESIELEKRWNQENNSLVKATYPKGK